MARVEINLPDPGRFIYTTEFPVRIGDVNFGGHLGHDSLVTLLHEVRARFFASHGLAELNLDGDGRVGMIMADLAVVYESEAHFGDVLRFALAPGELFSKGCELFYRVIALSADGSERPVARAKTGIVFYDYAAGQAVAPPPRLLKALEC